MNKTTNANTSTDLTVFPFDHNSVDEDSLRVMNITERAALGADRITRWGAIPELTAEEWLNRVVRELERIQVETIISCAMTLEQDMPVELNTEHAELIGNATGNYLRTKTPAIVAGIDIEEDHSIDIYEIGDNN